jgi:predicted ribonuclease YlaK
VINHNWYNQNAVIAERTTQQFIEVARLLKLSKNIEITGINQNNKRRQNSKSSSQNEPQTTPTYKKTYSQVVSNNASEAEHATSMENMLAQIMQMLKDQNLRLNKIESSIKMTWQSLMANSLRLMEWMDKCASGRCLRNKDWPTNRR